MACTCVPTAVEGVKQALVDGELLVVPEDEVGSGGNWHGSSQIKVIKNTHHLLELENAIGETSRSPQLIEMRVRDED